MARAIELCRTNKDSRNFGLQREEEELLVGRTRDNANGLAAENMSRLGLHNRWTAETDWRAQSHIKGFS